MARAANREALLENGLELLSRRGFNGTGVQEIASASGVPKGSFYNYFASKDEFGLEVLGRYAEATTSQLEALLVDGPGSPFERLRSLFDVYVDRARERGYGTGCLAGKLCHELADTHPKYRQELEQGFRAVQRYFTEVLFEAQQAGELSTDADPDEMAGFLHDAWQGALLRAKATRSDLPLQQFLQVVFRDLLAQRG